MATINVESDGEFIHVTSPYDEDWIERAKELGGTWNPEERVWLFDADDHTIEGIEAELKLFYPRAFR